MFNSYLEEIRRPRIVVCFVGKFNPFHKGHYETYKELRSKFAYVDICTKLDSDGFLTAEQKKELIVLSGVPVGSIRHLVGSGYSIESLSQSAKVGKSNILIAAFSEKDMEEKQNLLQPPKKGGPAAWELMPKNDTEMTAVGNGPKPHGYIYITPSLKIGVSEISSSRIRKAVDNKNWNLVYQMMANEKAFDFLKKIKGK